MWLSINPPGIQASTEHFGMYLFAIIFGFLSIYVGYSAVIERQIHVGLERVAMPVQASALVMTGWIAVTLGYIVAICGGITVISNMLFIFFSLGGLTIAYSFAFWFMVIPMACIILSAFLGYSVHVVVSLIAKSS